MKAKTSMAISKIPIKPKMIFVLTFLQYITLANSPASRDINLECI